MQKEVPIECAKGKKIYFTLRKPPLWKGWILKPSHPEILVNPIKMQSDNIVLYKDSISDSDLTSFMLYLKFRIDEALQWSLKDRILLELEFIYSLLSKTDAISEEETTRVYELIKDEYGKHYYTDKCGRLLFMSLLTSDEILSDESQISPVSYKAPNISYLRECFEAYIFQQSESIMNCRSTTERKSRSAAILAVINKIPFWKNEVIENISSQLKRI